MTISRFQLNHDAQRAEHGAKAGNGALLGIGVRWGAKAGNGALPGIRVRLGRCGTVSTPLYTASRSLYTPASE
eukprot:2874816-Prymnesium_polylepis.1